eukprot:4276578-Pleurochrysis_carterae.AAC.1
MRRFSLRRETQTDATALTSGSSVRCVTQPSGVHDQNEVAALVASRCVMCPSRSACLMRTLLAPLEIQISNLAA